MNNAKIIQAKSVEEAIDQAIGETDKVHLATVASHLKSLRESVHFKHYVKDIIKPLIEKKIKLLRITKDHADSRYIQGLLDGIEVAVDVESFEKLYRLKIEKNVKGKISS